MIRLSVLWKIATMDSKRRVLPELALFLTWGLTLWQAISSKRRKKHLHQLLMTRFEGRRRKNCNAYSKCPCKTRVVAANGLGTVQPPLLAVPEPQAHRPTLAETQLPPRPNPLLQHPARQTHMHSPSIKRVMFPLAHPRLHQRRLRYRIITRSSNISPNSNSHLLRLPPWAHQRRHQ
jgi:hypothetical protein